ncbi:MAG: hypothetical protein PHU25_09560 [Deltaproteobacteria bacterium]|nr:hypothetical protein [Deltaproteobacteria bacterium]
MMERCALKKVGKTNAFRIGLQMLLCVVVTSWPACFKAGKINADDNDTVSETNDGTDSDSDSESGSGESTDTGTGTLHQGQHLRAIMGTGPNDIYAAGTCGLLLHFDGKKWNEVDLGVDGRLNAVWTIAQDNVLVGGESFDECHSEDVSAHKGFIHHFDGSSWQKVYERSEDYSAIQSIWGASPNDIYAGGDDYHQLHGSINHFDGSSWLNISAANIYPVCSIWDGQPQHIWGFSSGELYIYCREHDADDVWADLFYFPGRFNQECSIINLPSGYSSLSGRGSVWGSSPDDVFAVRDTGPIIYRFDGIKWSEMATGGVEGLLSIWGLGPKDVYAVGLDGQVLHYDGEAWNSMKANIAGDLLGVWGTKEAIYAVGDDNAKLPDEERSPAIYRYDGQSWKRVY